MNDLIKISEMSSRYDISARTLRYYEEMGLLTSTRSEDYAYRMYDREALKRLEQILILRKLNISIKDIKRIFDAAGSEVVLEVLGKKVDNIDDEVALLNELKSIVLDFIEQIKAADFGSGDDVKRLYEKASEIETRLVKADYEGNAAKINRLFEVTEKLAQKAASRLEIPDNVLKPLLKNVYFILGSGAYVADELGRKYGIFVYHTCDYRRLHAKNADPQFQPELTRNVTDFFALEPEDALRHELGVVHEYTPMVILDLIKLTTEHDIIICENDIDIDNIIPIVTNIIDISEVNTWDNWIDTYKNNISARDISDDDKQRLMGEVNRVWYSGKPENPRSAPKYGIKRIWRDINTTTEQLVDTVEKYFRFEEITIRTVLTGETQALTLDFVAHLRSLGAEFERSTTDYWANKLYWYIKYRNEFVGFILINGYGDVGDKTEPEGWIFWSDNYISDTFSEYTIDERIKEIAFNHVDIGTCGGGLTVNLFGKEFYPVCNGTTFRFNNPNTEEIECAKKLAEMRIKDIMNNL
jgi:DNA-binding transcriptional MerR regulator